MNKTALAQLSQFTGTASYTRLNPFALLLTDGARFLAENADCFWLFNEIAAAQRNPIITKDEMLRDMQFWTLRDNPATSGATLVCERDSGDVALEIPIPFTDFPFDVVPEVKIWVAPTSYGQGTAQVAYLPSEH